MKKVAIIECFNNSKSAKEGSSTIAHIKNNKIIANHLKCEYFITPEDLFYAANCKWDVLLFTNSSAFADHNDIKLILENNRSCRKFFITNDYNTSCHSALNKYNYEIIANFEKQDKKHKLYSVNLNSLMASKPNKLVEKKYGCIYWGAFRPDRQEYFKKYFDQNIYLSTTQKSRPKFVDLGCSPHYINPIDWSHPVVDYFKYSLYIEDKWIHQNFHNLANRWYEAGIHNNVIFFDKNCQNTIKKSVLNDVFDEYFLVDSASELKGKQEECSQNYLAALDVQKKWHEQDLIEKENVLEQIRNIVEG